MDPLRNACIVALLAAGGCGGGPTVHVCGDGTGDHATLAEAIAAAPPGARIVACPGIYAERLVIDAPLHLVGGDPATTVLDAGGAGTALRIGGGADVTIERFTVRGGSEGGITCEASTLGVVASAIVDNVSADGGGGVRANGCTVAIDATIFERNRGDDGGAVHVTGGALTLRGGALRGNAAAGRGGAIYLAADGRIEGVEIAGNSAGWTGGGVHLDRHAPVIRGSTIAGNTAVDDGGGVYVHQGAPILEDNRITGNVADDDGGGVRVFEAAARLARNHLADNRAGGDGGGLKISHVAGELVANEVVGNEAVGVGGGVELDNDASVLRGGAIIGNRASLGGGVHAMLWPWEGGVIEDVRIADNHAWRGGGLYAEDNFQEVRVRRVTIEGNRAAEGGGVYVRGTPLVMHNVLVARNDADDAGGGLYLGESAPWTAECPCPPVDPPIELDFLVVHGNTAGSGAALWTDAPDASIESSILSGHDGAAVVVERGRAPAWRFNDTHPASFAGMRDPTGADGNLATEPRFAAAAAGDFRLHDASACIDAGNPEFSDPDGTRADMGLHAGPEAP